LLKLSAIFLLKATIQKQYNTVHQRLQYYVIWYTHKKGTYKLYFNYKIKESKGIEQPGCFNESDKVLQFLMNRITGLIDKITTSFCKVSRLLPQFLTAPSFCFILFSI